MDENKKKSLKRNLNLVASPVILGFSPGKKLKKLLTQGSDEPEVQSVPTDDEATHPGASDVGKDNNIVQIVAANHLNLLQNINPTDVEKLVNQYQQQLANDTQLKPIHHFLSQRAQDMLE